MVTDYVVKSYIAEPLSFAWGSCRGGRASLVRIASTVSWILKMWGNQFCVCLYFFFETCMSLFWKDGTFILRTAINSVLTLFGKDWTSACPFEQFFFFRILIILVIIIPFCFVGLTYNSDDLLTIESKSSNFQWIKFFEFGQKESFKHKGPCKAYEQGWYL